MVVCVRECGIYFDTSNSSTDDKDCHRSASEIVCFRACSAATYISASLIGRSNEPSKFPGEELVLDIAIAFVLCDKDILDEVSEADLLNTDCIDKKFLNASKRNIKDYLISKCNMHIRRTSSATFASILETITHQSSLGDHQTFQTCSQQKGKLFAD